MEQAPSLSIVGCVETIELAELGLALRSRIDTGARSSALHVVVLEPSEDGAFVRFVVRGMRAGRRTRSEANLSVLRWAQVRAANGSVETRAFVELPVRLGGEAFAIEVGLTDRDGMRYPMLLGRSALAGRYLVDASRRYVTREGVGAGAGAGVRVGAGAGAGVGAPPSLATPEFPFRAREGREP